MNIIQKLTGRKRKKRSQILSALVDANLVCLSDTEACEDAAQTLPIGIPKKLLERLKGRSKSDPLVRQFVPTTDENEKSEKELSDPIGDDHHSPVFGLVHRYPDRVLLMPVSSCPVYCRFCFRRNSVGGARLSETQLDNALDYIKQNNEIWEVILSGGDPLILAPQRINDILNRLEKIDHVGTIRIHTRVPALDPDRITSAMLKALNIQKPLWIVLHCNHASEIDQSAEEAIRKLIDSGIPMLSQTVLLKGINDNSTDLTKLMRTLVENRIKPYYLHQGDLAQGTSHFRTTLRHGRNLVRSIRGRLSGIAQPLYVLDIPGGFGKVSAEDTWITPNVDGMGWIVEDHKGATHHYEDNIEPLDSE